MVENEKSLFDCLEDLLIVLNSEKTKNGFKELMEGVVESISDEEDKKESLEEIDDLFDDLKESFDDFVDDIEDDFDDFLEGLRDDIEDEIDNENFKKIQDKLQNYKERISNLKEKHR